MNYPHLFFTTTDDNCDSRTYWVVIAHNTFTYADADYMSDFKNIEGNKFIPEIDLVHDVYCFSSEQDALRFVRKWWIDNPI